MYILLRLVNGNLMEGLLLSMSEKQMRVAVRGNSETIDFQLAGSCWVGDNGDCVQIESIVAPVRMAIPSNVPAAAVRTMGAAQ